MAPAPDTTATARDCPARCVGVLLAAGRGRRMGRTKQLLPLPGDSRSRTLVAAAFDAIAPACRSMVVVAGHDSGAVLEALRGREFVPIESCPDAQMIESVRAGLHAATRIDPNAPVLLHPADHPLLNRRTLDAILAAARSQPDLAILPIHGGRGGHPVLLPPPLVARLLRETLLGGLREYWDRNPAACLRLAVDDASACLDIDLPEEYNALRTRHARLGESENADAHKARTVHR